MTELSYNTAQRKAVLDFLSENRERQFTVEEIAAGIGGSVGKSTVYRVMTKLVGDGVVKRFVRGQSRQFLYQLVGCESHTPHLHLKCTACGKLFHLEAEVSDEVMKIISDSSDFSVSKEQTVIFGRCSACKLL